MLWGQYALHASKNNTDSQAHRHKLNLGFSCAENRNDFLALLDLQIMKFASYRNLAVHDDKCFGAVGFQCGNHVV